MTLDERDMIARLIDAAQDQEIKCPPCITCVIPTAVFATWIG
jgi:hypothetical protein